MATKAIAIYCVNYNSYDCLNNYLASIDKAAEAVKETATIKVVMADNSLPTLPVAFQPSHFTLQCITTGENKGYFGAVTLAMERVSPAHFDYIIVSNVDVLLTKDFFMQMLRSQTSPETGWIAPAILSQTHGFDFNPQTLQRYSPMKMRMLRLMFRYPVLLRLKQKLLHNYRNIKCDQPCDIYAGHGSFIILTKEYVRKCGIINYPSFLYGEEIFLAETCRRSGLKVEYVPSIVVNDIGAVSTGKFSSRQFCRYNYQSIDYLIKTFF